MAKWQSMQVMPSRRIAAPRPTGPLSVAAGNGRWAKTSWPRAIPPSAVRNNPTQCVGAKVQGRIVR